MTVKYGSCAGDGVFLEVLKVVLVSTSLFFKLEFFLNSFFNQFFFTWQFHSSVSSAEVSVPGCTTP